MSTLNHSKTERIDIRASYSTKQLLQDAAIANHKSVSEFLLDAGIAAANQTLANRNNFRLDEDKWKEFVSALDRPVKSKQHIKKLLNKPSVLD